MKPHPPAPETLHRHYHANDNDPIHIAAHGDTVCLCGELVGLITMPWAEVTDEASCPECLRLYKALDLEPAA